MNRLKWVAEFDDCPIEKQQSFRENMFTTSFEDTSYANFVTGRQITNDRIPFKKSHLLKKYAQTLLLSFFHLFISSFMIAVGKQLIWWPHQVLSVRVKLSIKEPKLNAHIRSHL